MQLPDQVRVSRDGQPDGQEALGIDAVLADLAGGRLAGRITDAARLAYVRHLLLSARESQSGVEAEPSAR